MSNFRKIQETRFSDLQDVELLTEVKLSRVYEYFVSDNPAGIITAFRGDYDWETNVRRNKQLAALFRQNGFGYTWVDGSWIENQGTDEEVHVSEVSIMVTGSKKQSEKLFNVLLEAAKTYNQDAFVFKAANDHKIRVYDKNGGIDATFERARLDQIGKLYTKLRSGSHRDRSFVFEGERRPLGYAKRLAGYED